MRKDELVAFFEQLDCLPTGERIALKREAGTMRPQAQSRALFAFYKCLPADVNQRLDDRFFAAACLHCLWSENVTERLPLEKIVYRLNKDKQISKSMTHRLEGILDLKWEEDGFLLGKLTRLIQLAKSKNYAVDCAALLIDLIYWNRDEKRVRLRWASSLYTEEQKDEN